MNPIEIRCLLYIVYIYIERCGSVFEVALSPLSRQTNNSILLVQPASPTYMRLTHTHTHTHTRKYTHIRAHTHTHTPTYIHHSGSTWHTPFVVKCQNLILGDPLYIWIRVIWKIESSILLFSRVSLFPHIKKCRKQYKWERPIPPLAWVAFTDRRPFYLSFSLVYYGIYVTFEQPMITVSISLSIFKYTVHA